MRTERAISIIAAAMVLILVLRMQVAPVVWTPMTATSLDSSFGRMRPAGYCGNLLGHLRADSDSKFGSQLKRLKQALLQQTVSNVVTNVYEHNNSVLELIRPAMQELMLLWDYERIQRALVNPMQLSTTRRILDIVKKRLDDPILNPPLQIMVFGGSIALGREGSRFMSSSDTMLRGNETNARWSNQLEVLLNEVLFRSDVVRVVNMAVPGVTSNVSSVLLKYSLWPTKDYPGPDLVIASFGLNDVFKFVAKEKLDEQKAYEAIFQASQKFVKATLGSRNCGHDQPGIILMDDNFLIGHISIRQNLMHSRAVSEIAMWYNVMAVSYTKAFIHLAYADRELQNISKEYTAKYTPQKDAVSKFPLFGGPVPTYHPQLLYHTGMAWMIVFELFTTMTSACEYDTAAVHSAVSSVFDEKNPRHIPELHEDTFFQEVSGPWHETETRFDEACKKNSKQHSGSNNLCSYVWIASKATDVKSGADVNRTLQHVLVDNDGWIAEGRPVLPPRPGYVATKAGASFTIDIPAIKYPIGTLVLVYMKSYGEKWQDSKLKVSLQTLRGNDVVQETSCVLLGYHDSETSVNYDADFRLQAQVGDHVIAKFDVIGGSTFKITGMLFCQRDDDQYVDTDFCNS